jgi:hypothetical protein
MLGLGRQLGNASDLFQMPKALEVTSVMPAEVAVRSDQANDCVHPQRIAERVEPSELDWLYTFGKERVQAFVSVTAGAHRTNLLS